MCMYGCMYVYVCKYICVTISCILGAPVKINNNIPNFLPSVILNHYRYARHVGLPVSVTSTH